MNDKKTINRIEIIHPIIKVLAKQIAYEHFKKAAANDNRKTH